MEGSNPETGSRMVGAGGQGGGEICDGAGSDPRDGRILGAGRDSCTAVPIAGRTWLLRLHMAKVAYSVRCILEHTHTQTYNTYFQVIYNSKK